jgi:YidC/Oxa1 family membrane protein insertase
MDQRRLLLAFALSLLLLVAYQEFVVRRFQKPPPQEPIAGQQAPTQAPTPAPETAKSAAHALAGPVPQGTAVHVDTDVMEAVITPSGARLLDVQLKKYRRSVEPDSDPLDLVRPGPVLPMTLDLGGASDADVVYRPSAAALPISGDERKELRFEGESASGLRLEKRYVFVGNKYLFEVSVKLSGEKIPNTVGLIFTPIPPDRPGSEHSETAVAFADHSLHPKPFSDLAQQEVAFPAAGWAGFAAQYFLAAGAPATPPGPVVMTTAEGIPVVRIDAPVKDGEARFVAFFGPKAQEVLAGSDYRLDRALDFGWFWFIAIPLLQALRFLHRLTGNFGIAIIVLTALVKVATIPLTQATFRNMREMQKIQPQMAKLRERFKDDQMALQKEMMELYRRHRVNPLSGCLPMALQLPIFVGLYNALSHAIELRHAHFAFWIRDLSAPDWLMITDSIGLPVLTLLMGASMFLQTWMSPAQGDPTQQKMMLFMPLIFTFMFINFPAGLVLYWLVNNILTIAQQYVMMREAK